MGTSPSQSTGGALASPSCKGRVWPAPVNEPWRYQRRIGTLGPRPKRDPIYRTDWLEASRGEAIEGNLSIAALAVADVIADASTRHGDDVNYLTQAEIAKRCRKRNGDHFKARWAARGLTELRTAGLLDWDHGTPEERADQQRRRRLNGRWQGPCIYRLLIPAKWVMNMAERRRELRAKTAGKTRHVDAKKARRQQARERALLLAAEAAKLASSYKEALAVLEAQTFLTGDSELWNLALEQLSDTWLEAHPPGSN